MDFHADNNPPAEVVYDSFPDDWIAYVGTLPLCVKCGQNHQHLPGATRCIECLENKPGPLRRRAMYRIVHEGGHYCSSCYVREAPELGHSCARCVNSRAADKLRRKLNVLLAAAMRKLEMVNNAVESVGDADNLLVATEHAMKAVIMVPIVYYILQTAQETLDDLAELDATKADAVAPNMLGVVERYREARRLTKDAFLSAATAWLEQGNENQGNLQALSNIDHFIPSIPLQQHAQNHDIQHRDNHQNHPIEQYAQNYPLQQHAQNHPIQHHDNHQNHPIEQHAQNYPLQQHAQNHPIQHHDNHQNNPIEQHAQNYPIQQHAQNHPIKQHDNAVIQQKDDHANLQPAAPQPHNEDQEDQAYLLHDGFVDNVVPQIAPRQADENPHHVDNLFMYEDNTAPVIAPNETNENNEPHPDDILFNPYYQNQQYNPLRRWTTEL